MRLLLALLISTAAWLAFAAPARLSPVRAEAAAPAYRVIVHLRNARSVLPRSFVAEAFLKKTTRWPQGEVIRPVDLTMDAASRRKFTEEVLGRSLSAVRSYWQQLIFSGRDVPPPELDSDAAVIAYVQRNPGGIGYVSGAANLAGVKPVELK
jgi:ABC-type phosphate transport system substrate-binding protein